MAGLAQEVIKSILCLLLRADVIQLPDNGLIRLVSSCECSGRRTLTLVWLGIWALTKQFGFAVLLQVDPEHIQPVSKPCRLADQALRDCELVRRKAFVAETVSSVWHKFARKKKDF